MSIFNWPYTNFHELNLDWVLRTMKTAVEAVERMADSLESYAQRLQQAEQDIDALEDSRVSFAAEQQLTSTQKQRARTNIDAAPSIGVVYYNQEMALDNTYKAQARDNIGAAAAADIPDVSDVVRTSAQTLTDAQKTQARTNIGAAAASAIPDVSDVVRTSAQTLSDAQQTQARTNINAQVKGNYVSYGEVQTIDSMGQARARGNIGAAPDDSTVQVTAQSFTGTQKTQARSNIQAAEEPTVVDYTQDTGAVTITAIQNNHIYEIGNGATSVTITSIQPAAKSYMIVLTTGSTAPTVTGLSGVKGLESWAPDARTIYEISVYDGRAVIGSWEVTP